MRKNIGALFIMFLIFNILIVPIFADNVNGEKIESKSEFTVNPSDLGYTTNHTGEFHYNDQLEKILIDDFGSYDNALLEKEVFDVMNSDAKPIESVEDVQLMTDIGVIPNLPSKVSVTYVGGESRRMPVVWDIAWLHDGKSIDGSHETIIVNGSIKGTDIVAKANVKVSNVSIYNKLFANVKINNNYTYPGSINGIFKLYNKDNIDQSVLILLAVYTDTGVMIELCDESTVLKANTLTEKELILQVPEENLSNPVNIKAFVWGGDYSLTPLTGIVSNTYKPVTNGEFFNSFDVQLNDGQFSNSLNVGGDYILSLDVNRLAASLYANTNKPNPGSVYGGWEDGSPNGLSGHSLGHYMSACVNMYMQTGNIAFKNRVERAIELIGEVQDEDGFVGGFARSGLDYVFDNPNNFTVGGPGGAYLNGIWAPWYSLHKIYAGLIDAYTCFGNEQALEIAENMAGYAKVGTDKLDDTQIEKMLLGEHGGINESFAQLYEITGKAEYIELAKRFSQKSILTPLSEGKDELTGLHANTQIPKLIGAAKIYALTGDIYYKNAAENFWNIVINHRSNANGGNSDNEHFTAFNKEPISHTSTETCNTYNMLKLTEYLYSFDYKSQYIDYFEDALYNHILGSQNPRNGNKTYFIDLRMGGNKTYRNTGFECCVGTGMENPGRYYKMIYYKDNLNLFVNLFINSTINWEDTGMKLTQTTHFPNSETSTIYVDEANNTYASIHIRVPTWTDNAEIKVNGSLVESLPVNGYVRISRQWNKGDKIEVSLPMNLSLYQSRESENAVAFKYGPILLAGDLGANPVRSIVVDSKDPNRFINRTNESELLFSIDSILQPGSESIFLKPFYDFISERHMVYWNLYTTAEYTAMGGPTEDFETLLEKVTIDSVFPYNQQSEMDHGFQYVGNCQSGYYAPANGGWRDLHGVGHFSYQLKVDPTKTNYLLNLFWGSDISTEGKDRKFDIIIDGTVIKADYVLNNNLPGKVEYMYCEIPAQLIEGKEKVTVTYRSNSDNTVAGGVFGVRITTERL